MVYRVCDLCHGIKLKMRKKGAQPSVQISIKIKKGKQFCRWLLLMLMLLLFSSHEAELRDIGGTCAGRCVLVLNKNEHTHGYIHTQTNIQEIRTSGKICGGSSSESFFFASRMGCKS